MTKKQNKEPWIEILNQTDKVVNSAQRLSNSAGDFARSLNKKHIDIKQYRHKSTNLNKVCVFDIDLDESALMQIITDYIQTENITDEYTIGLLFAEPESCMDRKTFIRYYGRYKKNQICEYTRNEPCAKSDFANICDNVSSGLKVVAGILGVLVASRSLYEHCSKSSASRDFSIGYAYRRLVGQVI
ncbi:hypothetical protein OFN97_05520 [Campylobacter sp. VBCF_05 NA6]|uniref:hypothetical protein n=1 Tax=unclassified Campylobacter TaxID=2593542 RepID=UPI0022E99F83|nr:MULTISPECIES: hypothetical protein [unclassified Campylobacter]MDA3057099.1 hypothetical protein [Campylobacter sp. VBCF_04 NA7]MDA3059473.1 hypothetical protein [Campylobacter sp. VBCF_05 NA6]